MKISVSVVVVPLVIYCVAKRKEELRKLTLLFVLSVTVSCAVGVVEGPPPYSDRILGLTSHPNSLALTCVLAVAPALAFLWTGSRFERTVVIPCLPIITIGLIESGSRAGLIGTWASVVTCAIFLRVRWLVILAVGGVMLTGLAVSSNAIVLSQGSAVDRLFASSDATSGATQSDEGRLRLLNETLEVMERRPLIGEGLQSARSSHNVFLQVLSASGVIGFVGFVSALIACFKPVRNKHLVQLAKQRKPGPMLIVCMSSGFLGFLVADFFQNALWERFMWAYPAILLLLYNHETVLNDGIDTRGQ